MTKSSTPDRYTDAFGPVALEAFALAPNGAYLFRAQHQVVVGRVDEILACVDGMAGDDRPGQALAARNALTSLIAALNIHQALEATAFRRAFGADARQRMPIEQAEREMAPVLAELASLSYRFATPSAILGAPAEFGRLAAEAFTKLTSRFRAEERDLYPVFERAVGAGVAGAALLEAA